MRPWAIKIVNGKMKKMIESLLKPVIITVKMRSSVAMELREAKKPLVEEKIPMRAIAKVGRPMSGARIGLFGFPRHDTIGVTPATRLFQKLPR